MNKKVLTFVGCLLAAASVSAKEVVKAPVYATEISVESRLAALEAQLNEKADKSALVGMTKDLEFHGYGRSGMLLDANSGLRKANDFNKGLVGRLGNENDTYLEAELTKLFRMDNGSWAKWTVMFAKGTSDYNDWNGDVALRQGFAEMGNLPAFKGAFKDSTIWAGKRYYNRRDIHITDYYYTDFSGTGAGIGNIALGGGALDLAVLGRDSDVGSSDDVVGIFAKYVIGNWEIDLYGSKSQGRENGEDDSKLADTGYQMGLFYNHSDFYWMTNGFSKFFFQAGGGLNSGEGLGKVGGGSRNYDNEGLLEDDGVFDMLQDGYSFRLGTWGVASLNPKWDLMSEFVIQYDSGAYINKDNDDTALSFVMRPIYKVNENFELQFEGGYGFRSQDLDGNKDDVSYYKATFAPTFKLDTNSVWVRPEIRTFVSYVASDKNLPALNGNKSEVNVGVQAEVWF